MPRKSEGADDPRAEPRPAGADSLADAVARFQRGSGREDAFRRIYEALFPALRRFFERKGLAAPDSLDLTQETFVGIYRGLDGYRREARFETWVYRIATTVYLKRLRSAATSKRAGHELVFEEDGRRAAGPSPPKQLDAVLDEERRVALRRAVRRLPEQMRRCLTLRLYHDLKYREIAMVLKIKIDTVKAHLFQARQRLADDLLPPAPAVDENGE